ncbi:MAG: AraC family transcriptional regulator [Bacteroidales bacterium]|nr:AraC family transcriptional regulator [Bacteroidales bacterium]
MDTTGERLFLDMIDISASGWISSYATDFVMAHNPVFNISRSGLYQIERLTVLFCEKGEVRFRLNLKEYSVTSGSLFILHPEDVVEPIEGSHDFDGTFFFVSDGFMKDLNLKDRDEFHLTFTETPYLKFKSNGISAMQNFIMMTRDMLSIKENPNRYEVIQLLFQAYMLCIRSIIKKNNSEKAVTDGRTAIFERFLALLKDNCTLHRNVEFYAEQLQMTPKYMSTVVKQVSGRSAGKWIDDNVILRAKAMLAQGNKNIKTICDQMGFPSLSFFGRYFKRVTGMSPRDYRKSVRGILPYDEKGDMGWDEE